jgi:hypothetical protein
MTDLSTGTEAGASVTSYDLLRERLAGVADRLATQAVALNNERAAVFSPQPMTLAEQDRVHTDAACLPRDAVSIGELMLLGYNIPAGLATNRSVNDVFALYRLAQKTPTDWDVLPVARDDAAWFLGNEAFQRDFGEIYRYYADARLVSLGLSGDELRMSFGIGTGVADLRTLRWRMPRPGSNENPLYIDAYGEDAGHVDATFDFEWKPIGREALVSGRWPHLNVLDTLFVGASKGVLDFRIDDPLVSLAEGGRSVGSDRVNESEADVAEHRIAAARVGDLVLLRMLPYREEEYRYYAYSRLSRRLERIDAIGRGCRMLPEDQGIVFPGGYLLASGETRVFATDAANSRLIASYRSPNGEDVLYAYRRPDTGGELLCAYNLVRREMSVPVAAIGYALFPDGTVVCVRDTAEPQRVHTVAIYNSPFCVPEKYDPPVQSDSMFGRVGNSELVAGISEAMSLAHESGRQGAAGSKVINRSIYEAVVSRSTRLLDHHAWLADPEAKGLSALLVELRKSAGDVIDELATVAAGQREAAGSFAEGERKVADLIANSELALRDADAFINSLTSARQMMSELAVLADVRYVEAEQVAGLREKVEATYADLGSKAVDFLGQDASLDSLRLALKEAERSGMAGITAASIQEQIAVVDETGSRIGLLTEVVGSLDVADVTQRTAVLGRLSDLLAQRNTVRAGLDARRSQVRATENEAAFGATNAVIAQRLQSALLLANDAAACDASTAELLAEVENAELTYGDVDRFSLVLESRRTEVVQAFARRRDELVRNRSARIDRLVHSATRTIGTLGERANAQADRAAVDTLFATDPLATRIRSAIAELRSDGEDGRAGELDVLLTAARDAARRSVTDRSELFADGTVLLGRHKVGVNNERFDLRLAGELNPDGRRTVVAKVTGTDLTLQLAPSANAELLNAHSEWIDQSYGSETATICRALALALSAFDDGLLLTGKVALPELVAQLRTYGAAHPDLGAEPGIHDEDGARFLMALAPSLLAGASLQASGSLRAAAVCFRSLLDGQQRVELDRQLRSVAALGSNGHRTMTAVVTRWDEQLTSVLRDVGMSDASEHNKLDVLALLADPSGIVFSRTASSAAETVKQWALTEGLELGTVPVAELFSLISDRLVGLDGALDETDVSELAAEVCALILYPDTPVSDIAAFVTVEGLRSSGPGIVEGSATVPVARRLTEWRSHRRSGAAAFAAFDLARQTVLGELRQTLMVDQLRPRVITGFVRNRLVDEVLLPLVGDAIAKQLGLSGPAQGLLLLISPPGYGKTTLLEYVASLLGFAMVKINGPAIGAAVTSLDPALAPDAASAGELIKLNRAFAMGTNTMCLIDDIQHLHPELLQRFISLCDATRRIEGVVDGAARSFDLRGKRFVMAMAGNPYTSAGASFRLPDMLANRADVHNLGDLVGTQAMSAAFAQSYVENACGANETLRPLLAEGRHDIEVLLGPAQTGAPVQTDQLRRTWSTTDLGPMVKTLRHLLQVRDTLLKVNAAYIESAQMTDAMRGEPAFLLQGSYRNMARIAQRIVPVMTPAEVSAVIVDHYRSESQTLASSAGWNLAKWRVVVGLESDDDAGLPELRSRWSEARAAEDPVGSVVTALKAIENALLSPSEGPTFLR